MSLEGVTLILVGVANSMRKKNYLSSLLRCYILENWYFDELRGLFIILKIKIIVCQWTMLWQLKCIWCGVFFTDTSLPFEIRLTIVEQNGSNVNATGQTLLMGNIRWFGYSLFFPLYFNILFMKNFYVSGPLVYLLISFCCNLSYSVLFALETMVKPKNS